MTTPAHVHRVSVPDFPARPALRPLWGLMAAGLLTACPPAPTPTCGPTTCSAGDRTVCTVVDGQAQCSCRAGLEDDGAGGCRQRGPCASNPCSAPNRSVCVEQGSTAVCLCESGYRDDGTGACVALSTCVPGACPVPNRGQCSEAAGVVTCGCDPGYRDDGAEASREYLADIAGEGCDDLDDEPE